MDTQTRTKAVFEHTQNTTHQVLYDEVQFKNLHEKQLKKKKNSSIGHFRVPRGLCIKTRLSAQMIFHSHANTTHFHNKGCALGLTLKVRVFGTR